MSCKKTALKESFNIFRLNKFSLLYKNTLSSASLILLACTAIGIILLNSAVSELREVDQEQTGTRIELVVNDLDNQVELMNEAALRISTTALYRPSFRNRSVLDEVELIEDIIKYDTYSAISDSCFLLYKGEQYIYRSHAKNDFYVCANVLGIDDHKELYRRIDAASDFEIIKFDGKIFFVCPVFFQNHNSDIPDAYLCFVSQDDIIIRRINDVSGGFECCWKIGIGNETLAQSGSETSKSHPLLIESSSGFCFELYQKNNQFRYFTLMNTGFVILISIALLGVTALVTYKNYLPIKRVVEKYSDDSVENVENELEYIDSLINESHAQQKELNNSIKHQRSIIARQLFTELLKGGHPEKEIIDDIFQFGSFAVLTISTNRDIDARSVINAVELLSGKGITFYCVRLEQLDYFTCLACFESGPRISEAEELVAAAMELTGIPYSISACAVEDIYDGIRTALMDSLDKSTVAADVPELPDSGMLLRITAEIKTGSEQSALVCLRCYIDSIFAPGQPTEILCGELICQLIRTSNELKMPLETVRIDELAALSSDSGTIYDTLSETIHLLCESISEKRQKNRSQQFDNILEYINQHALEYDLDQDSVAEHFGISTNGLYRMFKTQLGDNYKHYVTGLRINAACDYLSKGYSVQEVCAMVGYNNVSYFIKTFKSITGYTPNNYKNQSMEQTI